MHKCLQINLLKSSVFRYVGLEQRLKIEICTFIVAYSLLFSLHFCTLIAQGLLNPDVNKKVFAPTLYKLLKKNVPFACVINQLFKKKLFFCTQSVNNWLDLNISKVRRKSNVYYLCNGCRKIELILLKHKCASYDIYNHFFQKTMKENV